MLQQRRLLRQATALHMPVHLGKEWKTKTRAWQLSNHLRAALEETKALWCVLQAMKKDTTIGKKWEADRAWSQAHLFLSSVLTENKIPLRYSSKNARGCDCKISSQSEISPQYKIICWLGNFSNSSHLQLIHILCGSSINAIA